VITLRHGDCRDVLRTMPDKSVHCCVTSPPYFGLRDYGHAGQIGLEATPDAFVAEMVAVFRDVRRVLRDDGTLWLNLGDSYVSDPAGKCDNPHATSTLAGIKTQQIARDHKQTRTRASFGGLRSKNLLGIPWRVAFALQADGWYLRQDIIWSKPNPMPESVTDRCTKAHEYIFLMSKSARYFYDAAAIAEPASYPEGPGNIKPVKGADRPGFEIRGGFGKGPMPSDTRNKRSVWTVNSSPFSEAHFATFPPALIEPCILAGCPKGGTVLDPFGGAGTTGLVADRLGRNAFLIELNPEYAAMAERRIRGDAGMFAEMQP
jgi:DNA modification methylase